MPADLIGDAPSTADPRVPASQDFVEDLRVALSRATEHLERSRDRQRKMADAHRQDQEYAVGDRVLLSTANVAVPKNLTRKLSRLYDGSFTIEARVGRNAYRLTLPTSVRLHRCLTCRRSVPTTTPRAVSPGGPLTPHPQLSLTVKTSGRSRLCSTIETSARGDDADASIM